MPQVKNTMKYSLRIKLIIGKSSLLSIPGSSACRLKFLQELYPGTISKLNTRSQPQPPTLTSPCYHKNPKQCLKKQLQTFSCKIAGIDINVMILSVYI